MNRSPHAATLTDDIILDATAHFFTRFLRFTHRLFQCQLRETDTVKLQTATTRDKLITRGKPGRDVLVLESLNKVSRAGISR